VKKEEPKPTANKDGIDPAFLKFEQEEFEAALKASMQQEEDRKREQDEEEKMLKMVMEASMKEEEAR